MTIKDFQGILSDILRKYKLTEFAVNQMIFLYFLNLFPKSLLINHLTQLLEIIKKKGFKLKITKSMFAADLVKYLCHILIQNNFIRSVKII